ncbi:hypothetical protein GGR51DRAFT_517964 [Nemania sp. FL0031]|nr:hypothetical protein GGR51DRAFT_517964 [Nemania sp. FL0031]
MQAPPAPVAAPPPQFAPRTPAPPVRQLGPGGSLNGRSFHMPAVSQPEQVQQQLERIHQAVAQFDREEQPMQQQQQQPPQFQAPWLQQPPPMMQAPQPAAPMGGGYVPDDGYLYSAARRSIFPRSDYQQQQQQQVPQFGNAGQSALGPRFSSVDPTRFANAGSGVQPGAYSLPANYQQQQQAPPQFWNQGQPPLGNRLGHVGPRGPVNPQGSIQSSYSTPANNQGQQAPQPDLSQMFYESARSSAQSSRRSGFGLNLVSEDQPMTDIDSVPDEELYD